MELLLIVYNPILNLRVQNGWWAAGSLIAIPLILLALTASIYNTGLSKLSYIERLLCLLSAASLLAYCTIHILNSMFINLSLLISGVAAFVVVLAWQMKKVKATPHSNIVSV